METKEKIVVTGALGYSGKVIAEKLLEKNYQVKTITNSLNKPNPFGNKIEMDSFNFNEPKKLIAALTGYDVLINTYWVRFNHNNFNHSTAVANTKILFDCAKKAGIKKIVHVSITNPSVNSELEYFKGKGDLEAYLKALGVNYAIIRPAVLFGKEDILINNIAWVIRHLPIFGVYGKGDYKIQPIHVDDFADLIINECFNTTNATINAIGPETFTYKELVKTIMDIINVKKRIINTAPYLGYLAGKWVSFLKNDVTITREEIKGLMDNLLYVETIPTGKIKLTDWAKQNHQTLGTTYASELARRK
ncbi:MAG: epimerase [Flavobacteriales bacterium CG_4_9_14_3_um_filter_32_8]|nr:MAG: epimerase [Flavobacteriales bacterium CG_4_9_14_3_um_filter_32_8]